MAGPLFNVHPSQFLDFKEVSIPNSNVVRLFTRIEIENLAQQKIAYRTRTNAKDIYNVKHNPGFVEKGQRNEILIYVRAGSKISNQDRFVITVAECHAENVDRREFWQNKEVLGRLAHWKLTCRVCKDPESTMSMYQQQVQALKVENQMLRNKCDQLAIKIKELTSNQFPLEFENPNDLDRRTVLTLALIAVILSQFTIFFFKFFVLM